VSQRIISNPTAGGWELDPTTGYWMWAAGGSGSGGGSYDDTEVRGLIADNAADISTNSGRLDALEAGGGGGGAVDAYTKAESDAKYVPKSGNTTISGTLYATDFVAQ